MIVPITRKEKLLNAIATNGNVDFSPKTREEIFLFKILGADVNTPTPITRKEILYQHIIDGTIPTFEPRTRLEKFIMAAAGAELELPVVLTREEYWWAEISDSAYETITGAIVHFIAKRARAIKSLIANISYTQDLHGYSYPWPAGGGVNKFNPSDLRTSKAIFGNDQVGQPAALFGSSATDTYVNIAYLTVGTWTISYAINGTPLSTNLRLGYICDSDGIVLQRGITTWASTATTLQIVVTVAGYLWASFDKNAINLQIESGSSASPYAPYSNICPISGWTGANVYHSGADTSDATTYSITFPSEAGTVYGGTVDVTTGKLTVDRAMVDLGDKNWYPSTAAGRTRFRTSITDIERISSPNVRAPMLCSAYKTETANNTYTGKQGISLQQNEADVYVYDAQRESMTTADFKTAMSGVQLAYKLATPQTYQLTPTEVTTLLGDNTIWADTGDVTVTY